jgi:hypothetical protein
MLLQNLDDGFIIAPAHDRLEQVRKVEDRKWEDRERFLFGRNHDN